MGIGLTAKIEPKNAAFQGMVDDDQVIDSDTTSGNILISQGDYMDSKVMGGDATIVADGTITLNKGIADNKIVEIDSATVADNDFAKFTVNGLEGRSYSEVRSDINVEDGADVTDVTNVTAAGALMDSEVDADIKRLTLPASTTISAFGKTVVDDADASAVRTTLGLIIGTDVLAEQTIGIADNNLLEVDDADAADNDFAKFTAGGLEGRSYSEVRTDINVADGADVTGSNAPQAHSASHENTGGDEISVAGLSGLLADDQHVLDAEVTAAATTIKLDNFATPDDNTDLNATTTYHGLLKKLDGTSTNFMNGEGNWAEPAGGASQLSDLSDVGVSTPTDKNALMGDGDSWESRALVEADISDLGSYLTTLAGHNATELDDISAQDITDIGNLSGSNTGDQDLSGKANVDQTMYIGTTAVAINRSSATLNLAGIGTLGVGAITSPTIYGSSAENGDITIEGTSHATKTTSNIILQPNGGNVGIGTTSPGATLEINGSSGTKPIKIVDVGGGDAFVVGQYGTIGLGGRLSSGSFDPSTESSTHILTSSSFPLLLGVETDDTNKESYLVGTQYDSGTETEGTLMLGTYNSSDENVVLFGGGSSGRNSATRLSFYTAANTATRIGTERMRIDTSGNVGIGRAPNTKLDIQGTDTRVSIHNTAGSAGNLVGIRLKVSSDTSDNYYFGGLLGERTAAGKVDLHLATRGASGDLVASDAKLTVLYGGNVGIGVTDPHSKLEVNGAISSAVTTITASADDTNVSGINTLFINPAGAVNIGGFTGGVAGQVLYVQIVDADQTVTIEDQEGVADTQQIYMHKGADEVLTSERGGFVLICDGTSWYDCSHARHV